MLFTCWIQSQRITSREGWEIALSSTRISCRIVNDFYKSDDTFEIKFTRHVSVKDHPFLTKTTKDSRFIPVETKFEPHFFASLLLSHLPHQDLLFRIVYIFLILLIASRDLRETESGRIKPFI